MLTAVVLENVEAASEPPGEGVVVIVDFGDNDGNNVGGGGGQYIDLLLFVKIRTFDSGFGLQIRILTPSRVELIDKRSILCLDTTTNR
ncbi:hypothetical protein QTG54_011512 [Skeletonema marinoi]|uniref:Uncharacterized protein n=1 Tax=Skeletonema marinoi TaxID=267567 RepID=A0AAD8Y2B4_9STRA|nr:hypothetical protein QTG54_011512 [Skeletonema marinoi]